MELRDSLAILEGVHRLGAQVYYDPLNPPSHGGGGGIVPPPPSPPSATPRQSPNGGPVFNDYGLGAEYDQVLHLALSSNPSDVFGAIQLSQQLSTVNEMRAAHGLAPVDSSGHVAAELPVVGTPGTSWGWIAAGGGALLLLMWLSEKRRKRQ